MKSFNLFRLTLLTAFFTLASASSVFAQTTNIVTSATNPTPKDAKWLMNHTNFLEQTKQKDIELLFLGDSITHRFLIAGSNVWNKCYAPLHAADFGIEGDRTENVLWRIENGELDGISPKVVVLMIGTNNKRLNTSSEIVQGITLIVQEIHERLPHSQILLLGVFPCGERIDPQRDRLAVINTAIAKLDGQFNVKYLDIGQNFLEPDGTISREIMPDLLHPTAKGYQIWADAMNPILFEMMK